jgi:hypothetical protein
MNDGKAGGDHESVSTAKYNALSPSYRFVPVAVETLGALGDEANALLRDIGQRIAAASGEPRSHQFLMQRPSVTVQRGNAACILGTVASDLELDDIFCL